MTFLPSGAISSFIFSIVGLPPLNLVWRFGFRLFHWGGWFFNHNVAVSAVDGDFVVEHGLPVVPFNHTKPPVPVGHLLDLGNRLGYRYRSQVDAVKERIEVHALNRARQRDARQGWVVRERLLADVGHRREVDRYQIRAV